MIVAVVLLGGGIAAGYRPALRYYEEQTRPVWRTAEVTRDDVIAEVTATGEIKPVQLVVIGSFVSGPIQEMLVDFNSEVKKDQLLARVDPRLYQANMVRDEASLKTRRADAQRVRTLLEQAKRDETRAMALQSENPDYIAQSEVDKYVFNRMQLESQLLVSEAGVEESEAALSNSRTNLEYAEIRAPMDGIVVERKIDSGQTVAASFQTPELFTIAPEMEKKMHIFASVDEADIGLIRQAQGRHGRVHFTVDAWPDEVFEGQIEQIRLSSTKVQNVVTYPVVVAAANPDRKLMPGMTASMSFVVGESKDVLRVPRAALRFFPDKKHVRPADQKLVEGAKDDSLEPELGAMTSVERMVTKRRSRKRHVWVSEDHLLRAIEVEEGISDNRFTEVRSAELKPGLKVVIGLEDGKNRVPPS